MTETMKVLEAIGQLKIQEDRFFKAMRGMKLITANRQSAKKVDGMKLEDFTNLAKSSYDSTTKLLDRYLAMKKAINEFNASTKITICGEEMSVAAALYIKEHGIHQKKQLLDLLSQQLYEAESRMRSENGDKLEDAAERNAKQRFEGDTKADGYLDFLNQYKEDNQYILIDPLNIRDKIAKLEDWISKFESGVDTQIQIANATHDITIEY